MSIIQYSIKTLGSNRGIPRLWLESLALAKAGFLSGKTFQLAADPEKRELTLAVQPHGNRLVSGKKRGETTVPVIDINSAQALGMFDGMPAVRVIVMAGKIVVTALASVKNATERLGRLKQKLVAGAALSVAGLAFGGGILDHAVHSGLAQAGLEAKTTVANEIAADLLEHASTANDALSADALQIAAPMQEAAQDAALMARLPHVDICVAGIPCSGASRAGKSKHGISMMESHPEVGSLVVPFLQFVHKLQPAAVVVENVPEYAKSASAEILRAQFRDMGYSVHEHVLHAAHYGCIENRIRWVMVAVTTGIEINLEDPLFPSIADPVSSILESIGPEDERWRSYDYLKVKQERDAAKGNGFGMQLVSPSDTSVGVIRRLYSKAGSTDPLLVHPANPDLLRKFTGREHARIKQVPERLVQGLAETDQHIVLGQGIAYEPFRHIGRVLGQALQAWAKNGVDMVKADLSYSIERMVG